MAAGIPRSILVTGGAGFIGANFIRRITSADAGTRVVNLDSLTYAGNGANLDGIDRDQHEFIHGDVRDQSLVEDLLRTRDVEAIVHFAAESHVDRSITGPDAFISTNVEGTHALLKAAKNVFLAGDGREHRFHHVSTDEVYGSLSPDAPAFTEANQYQPNSPYSASKAASDHLVRAYHHTYGLEVTTSNCSNNYGPYQFPEKLIPLMIVNILHGRPLPVYGDGLQVRDWLYVEDHCKAIELCLSKGVPGELYNIGGANERANLEIIEKLCSLVMEAFGSNPELASRFPECPASAGTSPFSLVEHVKDRPGHDRRYAIDYSFARSKLDYEPEESFESGFSKTLHWYLDSEAWWRSVMDGTYTKWIEKNYSSR